MTRSHDRTLLANLGFADPDKRNPLHDLACQYLALPENAARLAERLLPLRSFTPWAGGIEHVKAELGDGYSRERELRIEVESGVGRVVDVEPHLEMALSKGEGQYKTTVGFLDVALSALAVRRYVGRRQVVRRETRTMTLGQWLREEKTWSVAERGWSRFENGRGPWCREPHAGTLGGECLKRTEITAEVGVYVCERGHRFVRDETETREAMLDRIEWEAFDQEQNPLQWLPYTNPECRAHTPDPRRDRYRLIVEVKAGHVPVTDVLRQVALYREFIAADAWVLATTYAPSALDVDTLRRESIHHIRLGPKFTEWAEEQRSAAAPPAESEEF
jgi:hypothetical protein